MIGQTISQYTILEKLGEGGMGVVFKARDTKLDRDVALKFLPAHMAASEQDKARFVQEAKAAAALNHPNVCSIIDIQEQDVAETPGGPSEKRMFIVMEFVDGMTLRQKLESHGAGQPYPMKQAIELGIQIADGLAAAHEKGIVHRDVKPENIMVRKDGIAQIMDFGLAKLRGTISRITKAGSTVGTAGYMSPEQVQGQDADHRSDIFSFGVLLYELFTGRLPFKGVHETALLYEIVNVEAEPMASVNPNLDPEVDRIVYECLQKDPEERYQSMKEISRDLKRFRRESSKARMSRTFAAQAPRGSSVSRITREVIEEPRRQRRARGYILPAVTFLAGMMVIALLWQPWKSEEAQSLPSMQFSTVLPDSALIPLGVSALGISGDGKFMSCFIQAGLVGRLVLRPINKEVLEPVLGSESDLTESYSSVFSPDGKWVAFTPGQMIKKASVFGGAPVEICQVGAFMRGLWWGSDQHIYFGHISSVIFRVSENGGTPEPVTQLDSASGEISHRFPELLPDGKSVLYTIKFNNISSFDEAAIAVLDMKSGEKKILVRGGAYGRYIPTGYLVYVRGNFVYAVPFDLARLEVTGPPKKLFKGGSMNPGSGDANLAFSDSGTLIYIPRGIESYSLSRLKWVDKEGNITSIADTTGSYFAAALSPDGEKIALHVQGANDDVWLYHIGRKSLTRLTFGGGNNGYPVWTPDSRFVIYSSERGGGHLNIYRKAWDGSGKEERLTKSEKNQFSRSVTPDGKVLAMEQDGDIWMLALDGSGKIWPFIQSPAVEAYPVFSPDGKYLAYQTNESGRYEIVIVPFPSRSGKWQISSEGGTYPFWSPSGSEIYFTRNRSVYAVSIHPGLSFDFSAPRKVLDLPPDGAFFAGMSPDGKRFLMITVPFNQFNTSEVTLVTNWFQEVKRAFAGNE